MLFRSRPIKSFSLIPVAHFPIFLHIIFVLNLCIISSLLTLIRTSTYLYLYIFRLVSPFLLPLSYFAFVYSNRTVSELPLAKSFISLAWNVPLQSSTSRHSRITDSAKALRGVMVHLKGTGYLVGERFLLLFSEPRKEGPHEANPDVNSAFSRMLFPCSSFGGLISYTARTQEIIV